ncbi:uncharacterized protein BO66DRAFT_437381 [Aspergillus aculeatinus CBS 121060]|uniref:Uncharacterized protein n=1 Tax=Aspergillus aculeatinus CBS 121060 TaxID=1448322 RepID=A0ACD1HCT3_9EURO|nr:hypothetical protein BO66DRAFT_437381 [Aspergillus aculeatinus CBS 121060]RAH71359.1 hypothetical protein BO66DRAFT_437381 [Aspergillus aculeatinus CBS 121060]
MTSLWYDDRTETEALRSTGPDSALWSIFRLSNSYLSPVPSSRKCENSKAQSKRLMTRNSDRRAGCWPGHPQRPKPKAAAGAPVFRNHRSGAKAKGSSKTASSYFSHELHGSINVKQLEYACHALVQRHEVVRARFVALHGSVQQVIPRYRAEDVRFQVLEGFGEMHSLGPSASLVHTDPGFLLE